MAFTTPRTWVVGEIVTAAIGNTHWRDNLNYLYDQVTGSTYSGDNTANRAIAHSVGRAPRLVVVVDYTSFVFFYVLRLQSTIVRSGTSSLAVTSPDATNFYVGNAGSYPNSANATGQSYEWVALG